MIAGHAVSHLDGNARIWTLTVNEAPTPGALITWDEPAVGSVPAQTGVRGWITSEVSTHPGTQILTVAGHGSRWVKIVVSESAGKASKPSVATTIDDIITLITNAPDSPTAYDILNTVPRGKLTQIADQLYVTWEGRRRASVISAIITEARA